MTDFVIRPARATDISALVDVLAAIIDATGRDRPHDADFVRQRYFDHPDQRACVVAVNEQDRALGFQALKYASVDNDYDVTPGWGIIGTHIHPAAHRRGVGRALFEATQEAARRHALPTIDATIGADNQTGLAYYEAMGFRTYQRDARVVRKRFDLQSAPARRNG
ncbi:GNAT family N-acetyltransferase [Salinisphaera sp. Q1T1-3]|uniref:GNAT family N-acetyltransferase n=1 Tax=Salinisphaera sp. Q1T1-3 TaxID=2321229 RepID=UPI000E70719F|nr:GNAT family N-acetyltransferase [Salinisphaera sp. Q1T1-3]RJS91846.1 GNAT family N-acetyltransferase [Salinisphaera sp. Q1T1-3]